MTNIFDPTQAQVTELKVLDNCIKALTKLLGQTATNYGQAPWSVVHVAGNQGFREIAREKKNVVLPFLAMIVTAVRPSTEGYNGQSMYNGIYMGQTQSNSASPQNVILHMRPVEVDIQVIVTAQTFNDVTLFAQRWLFKERETQFSLNTSQYNLPIKVRFNEEMTIPEIDFSEMGNLFIMQTQLTFFAYVGVIELQQAITSINVQTDIQNLVTNTSTPINNFIVGKKAT